MLQFQHGYAAAGKVVTTIQSMMDDLMSMVRADRHEGHPTLRSP